jgi:hypothetical protein
VDTQALLQSFLSSSKQKNAKRNVIQAELRAPLKLQPWRARNCINLTVHCLTTMCTLFRSCRRARWRQEVQYTAALGCNSVCNVHLTRHQRLLAALGGAFRVEKNRAVN